MPGPYPRFAIPRDSVRSVRRSEFPAGRTAGVHGRKGRWLVRAPPTGWWRFRSSRPTSRRRRHAVPRGQGGFADHQPRKPWRLHRGGRRGATADWWPPGWPARSAVPEQDGPAPPDPAW